jgi:hypothetical protein
MWRTVVFAAARLSIGSDLRPRMPRTLSSLGEAPQNARARSGLSERTGRLYAPRHASGSDPYDDPRLASKPAAMPLLPASRRSTGPSDEIQALNHQKAEEFDEQNYAEWP